MAGAEFPHPLAVGGLQSGLLACGLLIGALYDLRSRRIPNAFNVSLLLVGLGLQGLGGGWSGLATGGLGVVTGLALLWLPFLLRLVKAGDVKLLAALGAWLGPLPLVAATVVGCALAGLLVVGLLIRHPALRREVRDNLRGLVLGIAVPASVEQRPAQLAVPLGTALAAGGLLTHLCGWGS